MKILSWIASMIVLASVVSASDDSFPLVKIDSGAVAGLIEEDIFVFKGIPYAQSPSGQLRWRPPHPVTKWNGVFNADQFGPWCPQILRDNYSKGLLDPKQMSEDCLRVNIWTPDIQPEKGLPVMVWINPGSFRQGSAQLPRYNGSALARQGVLLVSFDYRIGVLGQFAHPAMSKAQATEPVGNYGLMDQIAMLQWVQKNIEAFGGDPDRVTIFGMSAGGVSVNYLMTIPSAAGLFQGAISQSSGIRVSLPKQLSKNYPHIPSLETAGTELTRHFGIDDANPIDDLRSLTVEQLLDYQSNPSLFDPGSLNPVMDGILIQEPVGQAFREGRQHKVPYLTGATSWEGSLVVNFMPKPEPLFPIFGLNNVLAERLYKGLDDSAVVNAIETDFFYGSQRYLAKQHVLSGQQSWLYFFDRNLKAHTDDYPGAAHGAETRYIFQTLDSLKTTPQLSYGKIIKEEDRLYSKELSKRWVSFARDGRPHSESVWPKVSNEDATVMVIGQKDMHFERQFRLDRLDHFDRLFDDKKL